MFRKVTLLLFLALALVGRPTGAEAAQDATWLDLPPGIAAQAEPIHEAMMARCQRAGMSPEHMRMMMADLQQMADQLPPGVFLQILRLMSGIDMAEMMAVHQSVREGGLLQQPPGRVVHFVRELAR